MFIFVTFITMINVLKNYYFIKFKNIFFIKYFKLILGLFNNYFELIQFFNDYLF